MGNTYIYTFQFSNGKTWIAKSKMKQDRQLHVKLKGLIPIQGLTLMFFFWNASVWCFQLAAEENI